MPRIIRRFILESVLSMLLYSFVQVLMLHILLGVGLWAFAFQKPWDGSIVWVFVSCFFLCFFFLSYVYLWALTTGCPCSWV